MFRFMKFLIPRFYLTIEPVITAALIGAGGSMLGGLLGGDEPEYQAPTIPKWKREAQKKAWEEISAPVNLQLDPIRQEAMENLEEEFAKSMMGQTYGYNVKNLLDSGIYTGKYLPELAGKQAEATGQLEANLAELQNAAQQARKEMMMSYASGMPIQQSAMQNAINKLQAQQYGYGIGAQQSTNLGLGMGSLAFDYLKNKPKTQSFTQYGTSTPSTSGISLSDIDVADKWNEWITND